MSTPAATIRQELPPPGGYKPIQYTRIPAKTYFKGRTIFLTWGAIHLTACYIWVLGKRKQNRWEVEKRAGHFATLPLLQAERDRAYLKSCRKIRDDEEELMKDVPGWVVGQYFQDKIYWTRPADEWHDITTAEYFAHAQKRDLNFHANFYKNL